MGGGDKLVFVHARKRSLPPANEVWGKVIFSEACVKNSVHRGVPGWGVSAPGGVPGLGGCLVWGGLLPGGVSTLGGAWSGGCLLVGCLLLRGAWSGRVCSGGVPGGDPPDGYCYGQHASYWNASLLTKYADTSLNITSTLG